MQDGLIFLVIFNPNFISASLGRFDIQVSTNKNILKQINLKSDVHTESNCKTDYAVSCGKSSYLLI